MKEKLKQTKGITLIALIITIIILLILAVVSIRLIINQGILNKSKDAVDKYGQAEADEQAQLLKSEYEMAKYEGKFSGTYDEYALDKLYGLKIGDYVAYNEAGENYTTDTTKGIGGSVGTKDSTTGKYPLTEKTYTTENLSWRVLGVNEKGELELISDNPMSDNQKVYLANEEGYLYGPDELNTMCNTLYGKGEHASSARSLNVEDINKLGNYDPTTYDGYGVEWQYRFPTREEAMDTNTNVSPKGESDTLYMQYKKATDTKWTDITNSSYQTFRMLGESEKIGKISDTETKVGSKSLIYSSYGYTISKCVKQKASDGISIADIIIKGTGTSNVSQWLASGCVSCSSYYARFYVRRVSLGCVYDGSVGGGSLYNSYDYSYNNSYRVRPIVSLKSDIQIDKTGKDGKTVNTAYEIK